MTTIAFTDVVVTGGGDTHLDLHVAAALDQLGRVLGTHLVPTTPAGYRQLHRWLLTQAPDGSAWVSHRERSAHQPGRLVLALVSYGAVLPTGLGLPLHDGEPVPDHRHGRG